MRKRISGNNDNTTTQRCQTNVIRRALFTCCPGGPGFPFEMPEDMSKEQTETERKKNLNS